MPSVTRRCIALVLFAFALAGCASGQTAPSAELSCEPLESFYVVGHGWHTGIVVRREALIRRVPWLREDFGQGRHLEIGWGDARFYQATSAGTGLALRAILWPTAAVVHVVAVPESPRVYFAASEVIELSVPRSSHDRLLAFVADSFAEGTGEPLRLGRGLYGNSRFYRARGTFHAFNTCNTWVADAIRTAGYPFPRGITITARGVLEPLRRRIGASEGCHFVQ